MFVSAAETHTHTCAGDFDGDGVIAEVPVALELSIDCGCSVSTCASDESFSLVSTVLPDTQGCYEQFRSSGGFPVFTNAGADVSTGDEVIIAVEASDSPAESGEVSLFLPVLRSAEWSVRVCIRVRRSL